LAEKEQEPVSLGPVIAQGGVAGGAAAALDGAARQRHRLGAVPVLRDQRRRGPEQRQDAEARRDRPHGGGISRGRRSGTSALLLALLAACGGDGGGGPAGLPRDALLALPRTDTTPPPAAVFTVRNDLVQAFTLQHPDGSQTLFAELRFTPGSIVYANGVRVCDTCTVQVTVTPTPGLYGFTIGPSSLVFSGASTPTVTLSWGTYGSLAVWDSSARYGSPAAYAQALTLWYERAPGTWTETRAAFHPSASSLTAGLEQPGAQLVAALK
jgi:hypothetical protein